MFRFIFVLFAAALLSLKADAAGTFNPKVVPTVQFNNRSYYFENNFKGTWLQSIQYCDLINMDLVSIETKEEQDFISLQPLRKDDFYWTSGARTLNGRDFVWMATGQPVTYTNWRSGQPDNLNEQCLELWSGKGANWNDRGCTELRYFICEERQNSETQKAANWDQVFEDPYLSLNINLLNYNNKSYYIGNKQTLNYLDAQKYCQLINMELVSITSDDENERLHKYIRDTLAGDYFWSGGTKTIDNTNWVWLPSGNKVDYTYWRAGQPDNNNHKCIELAQYKNDGLFWFDTDCTTAINFICQAPTSQFAKCPGQQTGGGGTGNSCPAQPATQAPVTQAPVTQAPTTQSPVIKTKYYLSKDKASFDDAIQGCKNQSLQLVSIQNKQKNDDISKFLTDNNVDGAIWSSGNRLSDKNTWVWLNGDKVDYSSWNTGEPNNLKGNEYCIQIFRSGSDVKWNDDPCDIKLYYLCESTYQETNNGQCSSAPVVNIYLNNNLIGCNGTTVDTKKITASSSGQNVEVNNNIYEAGSTQNNQAVATSTKAPTKTRDHKKYHSKHHEGNKNFKHHEEYKKIQ